MASTTNAYNNNNRRDEKYFLFFLHRVVSFFLILVTHRQQVDWSEWRVPAVSSQQQLPFISFDIFDNLMGFRREFQKQALTQRLRLNDWKWILLFFLVLLLFLYCRRPQYGMLSYLKDEEKVNCKSGVVARDAMDRSSKKKMAKEWHWKWTGKNAFEIKNEKEKRSDAILNLSAEIWQKKYRKWENRNLV